GTPSRRISPVAGSSMRVRSRISVVLPELFGPITPTISPAARRSETSESANARREARAGYAKLTRSSSSSISVDIRGGPGCGGAGAQEIDEERGAAEGRDDADRELGGSDDVAGQRVGEQEEDAAAHEGGGHEQPVVRAEQHAERVRHDQPHEADRAREGHDAC